MEKQTRNSIIKKRRDDLIVQVYDEGDFLMEEIAEMFNRGVGTISRIVNDKTQTKENSL